MTIGFLFASRQYLNTNVDCIAVFRIWYHHVFFAGNTLSGQSVTHLQAEP